MPLQDQISQFFSNYLQNLKELFNYIASSALPWNAILIFIVLYTTLLLIRFRKKHLQKTKKPISTGPSTRVLSSQDIRAISGGDVMATQLDLARAYIEMDKTSLAKKILLHVAEHGNPAQQQEARQLVNVLK